MNIIAFVAGNAIARGALTGLLAAAVVDYHAFLTWTSFDDFASFNWKLAGFRWFQGALAGAITAVSLSAF